jgi:RNA-directed DNA polymerase
MVDLLCNLRQPAAPIRRVYIPKRNSPELRPLGIPVMFDRALQALVTLALESEWEAGAPAGPKPNSYGFRPGRGCHDALEAIYNYIPLKPKFVLDATIEKCFDLINHEALIAKLSPIPVITNLVRGWLKAGIFEKGHIYPSEAGTPQGGVISPLLANIALHGMETAFVESLPQSRKPAIIRYADDFVILHEDLATLPKLKEQAEGWLATRGLNLKAAKTRTTHMLNEHEGHVGFDFLGFTSRHRNQAVLVFVASSGHDTSRNACAGVGVLPNVTVSSASDCRVPLGRGQRLFWLWKLGSNLSSLVPLDLAQSTKQFGCHRDVCK